MKNNSNDSQESYRKPFQIDDEFRKSAKKVSKILEQEEYVEEIRE